MLFWPFNSFYVRPLTISISHQLLFWSTLFIRCDDLLFPNEWCVSRVLSRTLQNLEAFLFSSPPTWYITFHLSELCPPVERSAACSFGTIDERFPSLRNLERPSVAVLRRNTSVTFLQSLCLSICYFFSIAVNFNFLDWNVLLLLLLLLLLPLLLPLSIFPTDCDVPNVFIFSHFTRLPFKKKIFRGVFDYVPLCFLPACSSIYFLSYEYRNTVVLELEPPTVSLIFTSSVVCF